MSPPSGFFWGTQQQATAKQSTLTSTGSTGGRWERLPLPWVGGGVSNSSLRRANICKSTREIDDDPGDNEANSRFKLAICSWAALSRSSKTILNCVVSSISLFKA